MGALRKTGGDLIKALQPALTGNILPSGHGHESVKADYRTRHNGSY